MYLGTTPEPPGPPPVPPQCRPGILHNPPPPSRTTAGHFPIPLITNSETADSQILPQLTTQEFPHPSQALSSIPLIANFETTDSQILPPLPTPEPLDPLLFEDFLLWDAPTLTLTLDIAAEKPWVVHHRGLLKIQTGSLMEVIVLVIIRRCVGMGMEMQILMGMMTLKWYWMMRCFSLIFGVK